MLVQKHSPETMHAYNMKLHYNLVRTKGSISRAALSRLTGMSQTSSGRIINELIDEGLLYEAGETTGSVGRRATLLSVVPDGALAIGVDIDADRITSGLVNAIGQVSHRSVIDYCRTASVDDKLSAVSSCIEAIMAKMDASQKSCLMGVGVSVAGTVDYKNGMILYSPQLKMDRIPLKQILSSRENLELTVENNVKATTEAVSIFGGNQAEDFAVLQIGSGIGAALFSNGQLLRGFHNALGEIGHIAIGTSVECDCGRLGCIQSELCINGMENIAGMPFARIIERASIGDNLCQQLLDNAAKGLARLVANIANMYDPPVLLLCGEMLEYWPELFSILQTKHLDYLWTPVFKEFKIKLVDFPTNNLPILSAAAVILNRLLEPVSFKGSMSIVGAEQKKT